MIAMTAALLPLAAGAAEFPKPTAMTNLNKYLANFPLGEVTAQQVLLAMGPPKLNLELSPTEQVWTYNAPLMDDGGLVYIYHLRDGIVIDVQTRNGITGTRVRTASEIQRK
jgi:hypothetical protein